MPSLLSLCIRRFKYFVAVGLLWPVATAFADSDKPFRPPGQFVYLGMQVMYIDCLGDQSPTVLIDVGLGDSSANWYKLATKLSQQVRECVYMRAGYGRSNTGPGERTTAQITNELNQLLETAAIPGPYIIVGHSFGGFTARYFATRYPDKTAGVVLVESSHPEQVTRLANLDTLPSDAPLKIARTEPAPEFMSAFEKRWYLLNSSRKATVAQMSELRAFRISARQVGELGPMPDIPLAVLTRGKEQLPVINGVALEREWQHMQADLLTLSRNSWQDVIENSGHKVYADAPEAIIANVMKVVDLARNNAQHASHDNEAASEQL